MVIEETKMKPFPTWVDERAHETPDQLYASIPRMRSFKDGYRNVTYQQLSFAVNKMSWWLDEQLGKSSKFQVLAYMLEYLTCDMHFCTSRPRKHSAR
jgi:hypothetical protein